MIGSRLKELRKQRDLSLKEFGTIFNLSESTISLYENGKRNPSYELLCQFADYFNVTTDYLLCRVDNPNWEIKKAPPDSGADEVIEDRNNPIDWTPEKVEALKKFVEQLERND